jgi:hypothetical protein
LLWSAAAAARTLRGVRCAWGQAQEPGSLHSLLEAHEESEIKEVGLCMLDVGSLPAEWGLGDANLPPIGASPDGGSNFNPTCALIGVCRPGAGLQGSSKRALKGWGALEARPTRRRKATRKQPSSSTSDRANTRVSCCRGDAV